MEIKIEKFKKIDSTSLVLGPINIFIGANNSGKSSFIQGIQFAVSSCQTLQLNKVGWVKGISKRMALESIEFLYTPTRHIEHLYHGQILTGAKKSNDRKKMKFSFDDGHNKAVLDISRGRNGGFTTILTGKILGEQISRLDKPFCVYVPGLAGIPIQEKYEVPISIKKSATRGDSNNFLRNIIYIISLDGDKWIRFNQSVKNIYNNIDIIARFNENESEYINVSVKGNGHSLPIDSVGTGLLQVIQVFAYIEYFNPSVILLDEPDAHIHPTKQKALAQELIKRTEENADLKVVFSTHSRYILDALDGHARVIYFREGLAITDIKHSKILLDIGAADADYLFARKDLKYVIVTEDKVDNITSKKEFLKKFLVANGLSEDEFVLHSYESCTKVDFAKILEGFVAKQIPGIKIIVHFDRDQKLDNDYEIKKLISDCENKGILLFITEYSEIENYFCTTEQISQAYEIPIEVAKEIYDQAITDLEIETKRKLKNFHGNHRREFIINNKGHFDITVLEENTENIYLEHKNIITPGKELIGRIKHYAQNSLRKDPQSILNITPALINKKFKALISSTEEIKTE